MPSHDNRTDGTAPRIVVLDSDLNRRAKLRTVLAAAGVVTAGEAGHGIEGVNLVQEASPDAVLVALDDRSPRALRTMEALTALPEAAPVLAYAKGNDAQAMRAAMSAGVREYVAIPVSAGDLRRSLDRMIAQHHRQQMAHAGGEASAVSRAGAVVTVFGAKGGVGKTTVASNLAVCLLHETSQSVALIDLDTRFGDAALTLDVPAEASLSELVRDLSQVTRDQVRSYLTEHASGVMLLPAPSNPTDWSGIAAEDVERVIALLSSTFDYVVIDMPSSFNDVVASAIELANTVLVVTTLDVVSVKNTWLVLELLESWGVPEERLQLLINRVSPDSVVSEADVASALGRTPLAAFPYDRAVTAASSVAQAVVLARPQSPFSKRASELAQTLAGVHRPRARGLSRLFTRSREQELAR